MAGHCLALALALAFACGRIGYEPTGEPRRPEGGPPAIDASLDQSADSAPRSSRCLHSSGVASLRNAADQGPWTSTAFGVYTTATGLSTWPLAAGQKIGFDVAIDVSYSTASMTGPQGHRVGQYFFHVAGPPVGDAAPIGAPFADPRSFCTPTLTP